MRSKYLRHFLTLIKLLLWIRAVTGKANGANKVTGYATNLMSSLQESLKASSGIDVKEIIENFSGKGNVKQSIQELTNEIKQPRKSEKANHQIEE